MGDKEYWERHARNYEASLRWVLGRPLPRMLELTSEAVSGKGAILEVAVGTGTATSAIARQCDSVIATDYASVIVEALERRVLDAGLENVTCEQADIYSLSYEAGTFDAVVAANVLHLVPDLPSAIEALRKVTVPGGTRVVPTSCHDETEVSRLVSRLLAVTGFPGHRLRTGWSGVRQFALKQIGRPQVACAEAASQLDPFSRCIHARQQKSGASDTDQAGKGRPACLDSGGRGVHASRTPRHDDLGTAPQAGLRHRHRDLLGLRRCSADHRVHRRRARDREDSRPPGRESVGVRGPEALPSRAPPQRGLFDATG